MDNSTLIILLVVSSILIIGLVTTIISLYRKIKHLTTPRYGFLGKPLYIATFMMMAVATIFIASNINKSQIDDINAGKDIRIEISTQVLDVEDDKATIQFMAVPYVNTEAWGKSGQDSFDIYWSINGPEVYSKVQSSLNKSNTGGFSQELSRGDYTISVVVMYNARPYTDSIKASF